jgi:hypothetical protein
MTSPEGVRGPARVMPWLALVVLFFVPSAIWALSSPLYSVPDEPDQAVKAVSIWSGQLEGSPVPDQSAVVRSYRVPQLWANRTTPAVCYAFRGDVTPDQCDDGLFTGGRSLAEVTTYDGGFPPLYFGLVGWPGRLWPGSTGVYGMRLVSALVSALLLAAAVRALQRVVRFPLVMLGVLAAATPMTWFLSGAVNPNGLEIAAAIALWCQVLAIVRWRERTPAPVPPSLVWGAVACGGLLAFTRLLSPVFVGVIVGLALLSGSWSTIRSLTRERSLVLALGVLTVVSVGALAFVAASHSLGALGGGAIPEGANPWVFLLGQTERHVDEMIGWFGWLDTPPSGVLTWIWIGVTLVLIGGAAMLNRLRSLGALTLTVIITLALPVVSQVSRPAAQMLIWQGRHGMAIAVGIPLLAIVAIDRQAHRVPGLARRLAVIGVVLLAIADVDAVWWALHRYTLGLTSLGLDVGAGAWQPPLGAWTWVVAMGGFAVAVVAWTVLGDRRQPDTGDPPPTP